LQEGAPPAPAYVRRSGSRRPPDRQEAPQARRPDLLPQRRPRVPRGHLPGEEERPPGDPARPLLGHSGPQGQDLDELLVRRHPAPQAVAARPATLAAAPPLIQSLWITGPRHWPSPNGTNR